MQQPVIIENVAAVTITWLLGLKLLNKHAAVKPIATNLPTCFAVDTARAPTQLPYTCSILFTSSSAIIDFNKIFIAEFIS